MIFTIHFGVKTPIFGNNQMKITMEHDAAKSGFVPASHQCDTIFGTIQCATKTVSPQLQLESPVTKQLQNQNTC